MKRVILIGLDGLEPKIVETLLQANELPNLARLRVQGGYARVATTYPAQTPVAWSTVVTGLNPGGHGIFDFLGRNPATYLPTLALSRYEQKNAFVAPRAINQRQGAAVWSILSAAGIPSTIIRCPCTYPPDEIRGHMLAGVGVPDLRGSLGVPTFYTSNSGEQTGTSEKVVPVTVVDGAVQTHVVGPFNPRSRSDLMMDVRVTIDHAAGCVHVCSAGQPACLTVKRGEWSGWLKVQFKLGAFQSVKGIVRFYLAEIDPEFKLYASPVNFDPAAPLFPITSPDDYAVELERRLGTYYTAGMAEDHDGLINGRIDEEAYLAQCEMVLQERLRMMRYELNRAHGGLFFCVFDTPDRLAHMFWRFQEPDHPANRANPVLNGAAVIREHYRRLDGIVGEAMAAGDPDTLLMVLSDHGMNSFRRGLNLNTWLYENGLLALKAGVKPGQDNGDFFSNVDWTRTQAYALGLAGIYLNLQGREASGIVSPADAARVRERIATLLTGLCDPEQGQVAVRSVLTREQLYRGPCTGDAPDLIVNFAAGYRVSWATPMGGIPAGLFEDNTRRWAGDHVVDPVLVPGVLFMNRSFDAARRPSLLDIAPTILNHLGLSRSSAMEGMSLT